MDTSTVRVSLSPSPGFCIKSSALQPAVCKTTSDGALTIARGQKVFVNVAWDANVPPPPDASNEDIQRAMAGEQDATDNPWFVPVIVSEPRTDLDKGESAVRVSLVMH